jgi:hypothetical protein
VGGVLIPSKVSLTRHFKQIQKKNGRKKQTSRRQKADLHR